jgi:hypothetical protein
MHLAMSIILLITPSPAVSWAARQSDRLEYLKTGDAFLFSSHFLMQSMHLRISLCSPSPSRQRLMIPQPVFQQLNRLVCVLRFVWVFFGPCATMAQYTHDDA